MGRKRDSAKTAILNLLLNKIGEVVARAEIERASGIHDWPRRIRELREAGWDIVESKDGYILRSATRDEAAVVRGGISQKQRYRILNRDNSKCRRCGRTPEDGVKLVVDHIIPVAWGGRTDDENLWTLCNECNQGKKAFESDADAEAMKAILKLKSGFERLRGYFKFKAGQICTKQELQIVAGITDYQRRIRELRADGMNIRPVNTRGDYMYEP